MKKICLFFIIILSLTLFGCVEESESDVVFLEPDDETTSQKMNYEEIIPKDIFEVFINCRNDTCVNSNIANNPEYNYDVCEKILDYDLDNYDWKGDDYLGLSYKNCLATFAIKSGSLDSCASFNPSLSIHHKKNCYKLVALETQDPYVCDSLINISDIDDCYTNYLAEFSLDPGQLEKEIDVRMCSHLSDFWNETCIGMIINVNMYYNCGKLCHTTPCDNFEIKYYRDCVSTGRSKITECKEFDSIENRISCYLKIT
jgi:hypothetical protein